MSLCSSLSHGTKLVCVLFGVQLFMDPVLCIPVFFPARGNFIYMYGALIFTLGNFRGKIKRNVLV